MASKGKIPRTRNFACMVYPESAPENWMTILSNQHVPAFVSPLHDKDINELDNELKKAHYHVVIMFDNVKTEDQAKEIFNEIGGVGCETIKCLRGTVRYLCHLDNPDKARYNEEDLISFSGADYRKIVNLASDKYQTIGEMMDFCDREHCYSLSALLRYARENRDDWYMLLCDNAAFIMREYIKSLYWEEKGDM